MRYLLVRIWATLAIGLLAGALGDGTTEFLMRLAWFGGAVRDVDQQAVLPTLTIALFAFAGLFAFVIAARIAPADPLLAELDRARARVTDAFAALCVSACAIVGMEGYETHFGGLAPFDPRSVVVAHAPELVIAFLIVASVARVLFGGAIRCAARSGFAAAVLLSSFLRIARHVPPAAKHSTLPHPETGGSHVAPELVRSRGLRAPPQSLPTLSLAY